MTDVHPPSRLDRIEAILAEMAASQQQSQQASAERFSRIEATLDRVASQQEENNRANAELRQSIADLRQENATANAELRRENTTAIAELRQENATATSEIRQENVTANAELRREIKTNIDDVSAMIFEGSQETKQTINVEVDTLNTIDGLRTDVQTLTHFVRDGFSTLSQAIVSLSQELSAQIQNLIDITRDNTGRITRLENEDHH